MDAHDPKKILHVYLSRAREAMLWKLDGLSEYDIRRPMTPTGTNLLGLVKHLASVELGYFGETFGRPLPEEPAWFADGADLTDDMWAAAEESREYITGLYRRAAEFADTTIDDLTLDAIGHVPWWPEEHREVTLQRILVHMLAETNRHAGHADILRETIDGAVGLNPGRDNMAQVDAAWWAAYREKIEQAAKAASGQ